MTDQPSSGQPLHHLRNPRRIKEILEVRRILEPEIAALAAVKATERDLVRIRAILAGQQESLRAGRPDPEADQRFHLSLARATKNDVLIEVVALLYDVMAETRIEASPNPHRLQASIDGHGRIAEALTRRDADACRGVMAEHLDAIERELFAPGDAGKDERL